MSQALQLSCPHPSGRFYRWCAPNGLSSKAFLTNQTHTHSRLKDRHRLRRLLQLPATDMVVLPAAPFVHGFESMRTTPVNLPLYSPCKSCFTERITHLSGSEAKRDDIVFHAWKLIHTVAFVRVGISASTSAVETKGNTRRARRIERRPAQPHGLYTGDLGIGYWN